MELFNPITEFISQELLQTISTDLKEENLKVSSAIHTTAASLLEIIIEKKENKKFNQLLKYAGSSNILLNSSDLFREEMSPRNKKIVSKFSQYLLQGKEEEFIDIISSFSGLSRKNTKKIISRVFLLSGAFLGEYLVSGISFSVLKDYLQDERYDFQQYIPLEMNKIVEKSKSLFIHKLWAEFF